MKETWAVSMSHALPETHKIFVFSHRILRYHNRWQEKQQSQFPSLQRSQGKGQLHKWSTVQILPWLKASRLSYMIAALLRSVFVYIWLWNMKTTLELNETITEFCDIFNSTSILLNGRRKCGSWPSIYISFWNGE